MPKESELSVAPNSFVCPGDTISEAYVSPKSLIALDASYAPLMLLEAVGSEITSSGEGLRRIDNAFTIQERSKMTE